jgi:hypothetical protein
MGIGARLILTFPDGRKAYKEVHSGMSYGANTMSSTLIGVGSANLIETLEVHWPAQPSAQVLKGIPANKTIKISQGSDVFEIIKPFYMVDPKAERAANHDAGCPHHQATETSPIYKG